MDELPDTTVDVWQLNEAGLSLIPLGSPFELPPQWFIDGRCSGDPDKAKTDWPKSPRVRWKDFQQQAPTDEQIEQWTNQWPHTNWAIVTGYKIIVVDADSQEAVTFIENSHDMTRTPLRVVTSQGKHFYYRANPDFVIRNAVKKNKIDVRGEGGYVVAPGSTHSDGTVYQWETDDYLNINDVNDLPCLTPNDIAIINGFNGSHQEQQALGNLGFSANQYSLPHDGGNLSEGEGRNNAAASMAGQLIRQGYSLQEIKAILDQWNADNHPPLLPTELNTTIASIVRTHLNNHPDTGIAVVPDPDIRPAFAFSHVRELIQAAKPINWLVKGFLEMDSLSLMFGEPGCGKSFAAIDLACCVATGSEWHGQAVKRPGSVFYIAGEGFNGLSRRLMAWQQVNGYNLRTAPLYVSQCSASFTDLANARIVSDSIEQIIEETGGVIPSLIVIDTLARNFGAGDENATKEMNLFINHIDQLLRQKYACFVLIVHHTGLGNKDRARGNSALKGALDAEYAVVKSDDELTITAKKMKDADEPEPMSFLFESVKLPFADEDGEQQVSCVLTYFDKQAAGLVKSIEAGKKQGEIHLGDKQVCIIKTLNRLVKEARDTLARDGRDPTGAHIEVRGLRKACIDAGVMT
ncbi:AAA family ATPase [Endozoicomonas gorgoniicola]|uniref:AAA family ATPase n=1 Tax=Endozoicomonas gorgoniicola TaxID=1234144 RepID=A0ABT3MVE1_9GAMM|nr:AAA family ATPase [Endozoicomonas gorgoniicola]MCW7553324.1 AAA family ATPase [Endozoicomonas gorgoniicola]